MLVSIENILKKKGMLCNPNEHYRPKLLVFGVSSRSNTHTNDQHSTPIYFPTSSHLYHKWQAGSLKFQTNT